MRTLGSLDEPLPKWVRAIFTLIALLLAIYLVRGLWIGELVLYTFPAKSQVYVASTSSKVTVTAPLGLVGGALQLGGIAISFGALAVDPKRGRRSWLFIPPILMIIGGTALLHHGG